MVLEKIQSLPEGYSEGKYLDKRYGISKTTFNDGKSFKVYAEELGGTDFISLNYYCTASEGLLKPCEMPEEKVIAFLKNVEIKKIEDTDEHK
ncbi:peptide methionine sulfoxide reductase [Maribacter sp. 2308TA10-17]|uniref:peptide methionine sulfoxide reductase n=1 Tax=Maribacter sp. 2308TA10-17 TaxID=3386276 RepID=UPI0039BD211D